MKVTVMAGLSAKWNMDINSSLIFVHCHTVGTNVSVNLQLMRRLLFLFCFLIASQFVTLAQDTAWLLVSNAEIEKLGIQNDEVFTFYSNAERIQFLNGLSAALVEKGFLTATWLIESTNNDTTLAILIPGNKIYWAKLDVSTTDDFILSGAGYRKKDIDGKVFSHQAVLNMMRSMLTFAESNGYPFATVALTDVQWYDTTIAATLNFKKNLFIEFDTIRVIGNLNLNANYLVQYTGIKPGDAYNQQLLNDLAGRLKAIPFATRSRAPSVEFSGNRATVLVYLDEKQSSTFDFLIGVLPNNEITGRLIITGEGRLQLNNIFNAGELFNFHFSKLESTSKQLETALTYPYLPGLPFGLEGAFSLYLKDSTFLERIATTGVMYQFIGNNYVKALARFYNSAVLKVDTAFILNNLELPPSLNLNERAYGLEWNFEKLDYRYNPRKGYAINIGATIGTKIINQNATITSLTDPDNPEFDFSSLYDSIDTRTVSVKYQYQISSYFPLVKSATLLLRAKGAGLINDFILQNELYRIGGNGILRGFDEQSITASQYHVVTAEIRYLLSQNAFAALFFDGAYVENASANLLSRDLPYGFGAAVNFETKAGIFGLTYALGSQKNNPVEFKNTKIHFGYVNYF